MPRADDGNLSWLLRPFTQGWGVTGILPSGRRVYTRVERSTRVFARSFAAIALVAAMHATIADPELGRPFEMKPDEVVAIQGLRITFEGVADDSRCPTGAQCVWAGDAAAAF